MYVYVFKAGELKSAVREMDKLKGMPADIARDWTKEAKVRLTADEVTLFGNINSNYYCIGNFIIILFVQY